MTTNKQAIATGAHQRGPARAFLNAVLDLFSSIRLGVFLLVVLFIYSSIGSAGILYPVWVDGSGLEWRHDMLRQYRAFELTEFEWFHTWFFDLNILLICINLVVATLRRIPFTTLRLGVWMIHTGIIILAVGSLIYFGTKVEGDAPVFRRAVSINVDGAPPTRLIALPGATTSVQTDRGTYNFRVSQTQPDWPILSGDDEGKTAYSVSVLVSTPERQFVRQMLAGYPDYTQDVIPGRGRVKTLPEFEGQELLDEPLSLSLEYEPQEHFWIKDSSALQIRLAGQTDWIERPIDNLPRYNDYISDRAHVWPGPNDTELHPLQLDVPETRNPDPLAGADVTVTGYLRYAFEQTDITRDGPAFYPVVDVVAFHQSTPDDTFPERLFAFDPERNRAFRGALAFEVAASPEDLEDFRTPDGRVLDVAIPSLDYQSTFRITDDQIGPDAEFTDLDDTGWAFRVLSAEDALPLTEGVTIWVLVTEFRRPDGTVLTRWVADDPDKTRDVAGQTMDAAHSMIPPADSLVTEYDPNRYANVQIVAGPAENELRVFVTGSWAEPREQTVSPGQQVQLDNGQILVVTRYIPRAKVETRPVSVPPEQRNRDADIARLFAMIRLDVTFPGEPTQSQWLPFHKYAFPNANYATPALAPFQPANFTLPDGRVAQVMFARQRHPLPEPVVLNDFILTTRIGGFTGRSSSIRDWTSLVRFQEDSSEYTHRKEISTNDPVEYAGLWYFQSFWEPPRDPTATDPGSNGMNFTGLGIGNRNGVYTQLAGSCLAVAGMIYAFYFKPIIRRRRRERALAEANARQQANTQAQSPTPAPQPATVGAATINDAHQGEQP